MTKPVLIITLLGSTLLATGQSDTCRCCDTTHLMFGRTHMLIVQEPDANGKQAGSSAGDTTEVSFWSGFGVGVNAFNPVAPMVNQKQNASVNPQASLDVDNVRSLSYQLNFAEKHLKIYKNHLLVVSGMGLSWNNYAIAKNKVLSIDADGNLYADLDTLYTYRRNKLRVNYIEVPLMLAWCSNNHRPAKGFRMAAGIVGGLRYRTTYLQEYADVLNNNTAKKVRTRDAFATSQFMVKATARLSVGGVMLYGNYALTSLFKAGAGPDVRPFEIGLITSAGSL